MRFVAVLALCTFASIPVAFAIDESAPDPKAIAALEMRAEQASPKEQCFLYAELVHKMTELASRQLADGDAEHASASIKIVRQYASKIHMGMADDSKRLKNAEILVRHTAFRLKDMMAEATLDDRPPLEAAMKQLDQVQSELMLQVFKR
jgi:hypothetical protein